MRDRPMRAGLLARFGAYIALAPGTGIRTEEARALLWEHVDFGFPIGYSPSPG